MKKSRLLLGLALISMVTTGCDFLDNISGGGNQQEEKKDDKKKTIEPESISLSEETIVLNVDESTSIEHTVLPQEASQEVKYESFNRDVAIVYANGSIYGAGEGETTVRVISKAKESVYRDIYVIVEEELPPTPLTDQVITASSENPYSDEEVMLTTNAPSATWSITSGASYAHLSVTTGKNVNLIGDADGSVTVKAVAANYTEATKTITFSTRPVGTYYDVTFNSNGGSPTPPKKGVLENGTFTFPSPGTKSHYTFLGWSSDGGTTKYAVGETSPEVTANITYTAYWQEDAKYTVTYTAGSNGTGSYVHANQYQGSYTLLAFNSLTGVSASSGYSFKNYTVSGVNKNPGDTISLSSATNITVNFEAEPDPSDYYASINDSDKGETLKTKLHNLIKITSAGWSYNDLWDCYERSDTRPDGYLWDIYADNTQYTKNSPHSGTSGHNDEGDYVNREHMIPQSIFSSAAPMYSDAHHVLPSDGKVNGMRSNYPHGIVTGSPTNTSKEGCKLGTGTGNTTVFEPLNHYKGDIARIYFYFVTCYQDKLSGFETFKAFTKNTFPSISTTFLEVYLQWSVDDAVSIKETTRNNVIYEGYSGHKGQGNRNPFIDHPEYACKIWGETNSTTKSICGIK